MKTPPAEITSAGGVFVMRFITQASIKPAHCTTFVRRLKAKYGRFKRSTAFLRHNKKPRNTQFLQRFQGFLIWSG